MADYQPLPEFDAIRRRQQGQLSQQKSESDDALKRRFAMNGMLGSGAFQKSAELSDESSNRAAAEAMSNIDVQEQGELQRRKEVGEGRTFQTGEREGAQRFAAEEAAKGRTFQTGERIGGQEFMTGERLGSQGFATGERVAGQNWQQANMDREYDQNVLTNYINAILGFKEAGLDNWADTVSYRQTASDLGLKSPPGTNNSFYRR